MSWLPLRNFGRLGVIHDTMAESLPVGAWTDARNVRFSGVEMEKMLEPTIEVAFDEGDAVWMQHFSDDLTSYVVVATQTELWFLRADTPSTASWVLAGSGYDPTGRWQSFKWGTTCIFNNGVDKPQIFDTSNLTFVDLPNWGIISSAEDLTFGDDPSRDTNARCKVLLPYKNFLVAMGVSENGGFQPNTVWWSDATALASLEVTVDGGGPPSWDYESPATLSGKSEVGLGDGAITWGAELNENMIVYTEGSATAMSLVGGTFVMQFRRLFNKGCADLHLAAEFNNMHMVLSSEQIYVHDGSTVKLIAKDRVEDEFFKRAGKAGRYS